MWTIIGLLVAGFLFFAAGIIIGWDAGRRAGYDQ